jgi:tetratricopeptide (TPR) repeat protein
VIDGGALLGADVRSVRSIEAVVDRRQGDRLGDEQESTVSDQAGPFGSPGPEGDVYEWYVRGQALLARGSAAAAAALLERAHQAEPASASIQETLARALFDAHRYGEAEAHFRAAVERHPSDDYAHFGLGLALYRQGAIEAALEPLALAAAMRPAHKQYADALAQARATQRARRDLA